MLGYQAYLVSHDYSIKNNHSHRSMVRPLIHQDITHLCLISSTITSNLSIPYCQVCLRTCQCRDCTIFINPYNSSRIIASQHICCGLMCMCTLCTLVMISTANNPRFPQDLECSFGDVFDGKSIAHREIGSGRGCNGSNGFLDKDSPDLLA